MKALSLWQPWASLIALGEKRIETRSWGTDYRGPIAICSTARWNAEVAEMLDIAFEAAGLAICRRDFTRDAWDEIAAALIRRGIHDRDSLPLGAAVCTVTLRDCIRITPDTPHDLRLTRKELALGDFREDRYAWLLTNLRAIDPPRHVRGRLGLFDI